MFLTGLPGKSKSVYITHTQCIHRPSIQALSLKCKNCISQGNVFDIQNVEITKYRIPTSLQNWLFSHLTSTAKNGPGGADQPEGPSWCLDQGGHHLGVLTEHEDQSMSAFWLLPCYIILSVPLQWTWQKFTPKQYFCKSETDWSCILVSSKKFFFLFVQKFKGMK